MDDEDTSFATGYLILKRKIPRKKEREAQKRRNIWVWKIYKQRNENAIYHNLSVEMSQGYRDLYFKKIPDKLWPWLCDHVYV